MEDDGLDAGATERSVPRVEMDDRTRDRLIRIVAAMLCGETPERIAGYAARDDWPQIVVDMLARPGEAEELAAHVDLFASVLTGVLAGVA
jgi:hypothetical protein